MGAALGAWRVRGVGDNWLALGVCWGGREAWEVQSLCTKKSFAFVFFVTNVSFILGKTQERDFHFGSNDWGENEGSLRFRCWGLVRRRPMAGSSAGHSAREGLLSLQSEAAAFVSARRLPPPEP